MPDERKAKSMKAADAAQRNLRRLREPVSEEEVRDAEEASRRLGEGAGEQRLQRGECMMKSVYCVYAPDGTGALVRAQTAEQAVRAFADACERRGESVPSGLRARECSSVGDLARGIAKYGPILSTDT